MKYKFSGHQTFVFRYGWLEKGVRLIQKNPHGFLEDDVLIQLGVGKNMVESIKYWCIQTGLLKDIENGLMALTELGKFIFGEKDFSEGNDPYLEDDATLWLLHWSLMQQALPPEDIWSSWHFAFYRWNKPEFTKRDLLNSIQSNARNVSASTIERDVDCFVRNYAGTRAKSGEENFDSPFLSLELIQGTSQQDLYRFNIGGKQNLPPELVGFAILKFIEKIGRQTSVNVQNCLYDIGSPGQVFKLNEGVLMDYMVELEKITKRQILVSETAGLVTINYNISGKKSASQYADYLLKKYYGRNAK